MTFLHFLILVLVTLALAAGTMWIIKRFYPEPPSWAGTVVWGMAFFIIVMMLLTVTGILSVIKDYDPKIPRVG